MKKLKLDLDTLEVESFALAEEDDRSGTVHGRDYTSGPLDCMDQCWSNDCSNFGCPSEVCSGMYCNSLSGCLSYENTCGCDRA